MFFRKISLPSSRVGLGFASSSSAANIWDGGGGDNLWSTITNWDNDLFPGYGTLTFSGATQTTNVVDAGINQNMLLWTGTSLWTLNNANSAAISLFDNRGVQAKVENQSTGLVTVNAPVTFAATAGAAWGEINAVNGGLTFGCAGPLTVNGSIVAGIKMFGGGQATTFNNTVSAAGKWFATTGASAATVEVGGAFTSGDIYAMNGSTLKLNSGGGITTSGLRLGGDFGTTLTQNLALGATFALTSATSARPELHLRGESASGIDGQCTRDATAARGHFRSGLPARRRHGRQHRHGEHQWRNAQCAERLLDFKWDHKQHSYDDHVCGRSEQRKLVRRRT